MNNEYPSQYTKLMDLSLRRLRMLRELHRSGTVTAAAATLHYSPSGISQQLAQLERDVGTPLLERLGRRVQLTDAGQLLAQHAEKILNQADEAAQALDLMQNSMTAQLTAGVWASVAAGLVTPAIADLAKEHPGIRLFTTELPPEATPAAVKDGSLDLAFVIEYSNYPMDWDFDLTGEVIAVERLHAAVPTGSIPHTTVTLAELNEQPWILAGERSHFGKAVRQACHAQGVDPWIVHSPEEQSTAMAMVAGGLGVTLVSDLVLDMVPAGVDIISLDDPILRTVSIARRKTTTPRPSVDLVIAAMRRAAADKGLGI